MRKVYDAELGAIREVRDDWDELKKYNEEIIVNHTCNVVRCTIKDKKYKQLGESDQNIMKWSALFHDIDKKGRPMF